MGRIVLLVTVVSTFFCFAINAYTLQIAYPLWREVPPDAFQKLHKSYLRRLWPVITLPHLVMFFASAALLWWRPATLSPTVTIVLFGLNAAVVLISAFLAGPIHTRFEHTGVLDASGYRGLTAVSAVRVALMGVATLLLCVVLCRALR